MKIKEVLDALGLFAPLPLQESYDNAGLQVGLTETEVSGALLCLDVTEEVIDEAIFLGCNLIVSHHPLIFHKLRQVSNNDFVQRIVMRAIKHDITIVSMHTNLDNARGGVNFKMAEKLGLQEVDFFSELKKVVNKEGEVMYGASGVIGTFSREISSNDFVQHVKKIFNVSCVQCNSLLSRPINKVALCGGAGSFLLKEAIDAGADAFITGEMHYHDYFDTDGRIQVIVIGHYESEQYTSEIFQQIIRNKYPEIKTYISKVYTNPIVYL